MKRFILLLRAILPVISAALLILMWSIIVSAHVYGKTIPYQNKELSVNMQAKLTVDPTEAALQKEQLKEIHLSEANLEEANLMEANLEEADLKAANLTRANREGVNLTRAHLEGARIIQAYLLGANLEGVNFLGTYLREQTFEIPIYKVLIPKQQTLCKTPT